MIEVAVIGYAGRMGDAVVQAVTGAEDMEVACGVDPHGAPAPFPTYRTIQEALGAEHFDVLVDFTQPDVVEATIRAALPAGIDCVIGTTGLAPATLDELAALAPEGTCLFVAPNFTIGAVLMMQFAKQAAPYFPEAEVIEYHHANKKDAPSGTATRTAALIHEARGRVSQAPGKETEIAGAEARAAPGRRRARALGALDGLRGQPGGHLRVDGPVAHHPPRLVGPHVLYAWRAATIRHMAESSGLIVGLENFLS